VFSALGPNLARKENNVINLHNYKHLTTIYIPQTNYRIIELLNYLVG